MIPSPPIAKKIEKKLFIHDHLRTDNYYWLNDRNNPEVIKYLEEENAFTKAMLAHTENFQEILFNEMKSRIKEQDESIPFLFNGFLYYTKFVAGGEYPVYCRKQGNSEGVEEVLIDGNKLSEGHEYFHSWLVKFKIFATLLNCWKLL